MHSNFRKAITKEQFEHICQSSANHAIFHAATSGVSATDYEMNSGAGINLLITEMMYISKGELLIMSGDGAVAWKEGEPHPFLNEPMPFDLLGTLVSLDLNCNPDASFDTK